MHKPQSLSYKCKVLSFVAMVCVVMIHSHAIGTYEQPSAWCVFVQTLLMRTATNWAVPFFFVVSGFFFAAHNLPKMRIGGGYVELLQKKVRTLLVPYLLWTIIGTAISMTLTIVNNYLMHRWLFERTFMDANGIWGKLDAFFGIVRGGPSGNLALWYVHTLMVLFILSPILVAVARLNKHLLLIAGLLLALVAPDASLPMLSLKLGSIGWFCVGIGVAQLELAERKLPTWAVALSGICWFGLSTIGALAKAGYLQSSIVGTHLLPLAALSGIVFWWGLYDRFIWRYSGELPQIFTLTFWVYCLHGVITGWFLASTSYLIGKTDLVAMLASCLSICGSLAVCLTLGLIIKRYLPKAYAVLTGGR